MVYYTLHLARRALGTPVEAGAWLRLRRHRLPMLEDRLLRTLATVYLTAMPDYRTYVGLGRARRLVDLLLGESRALRRGRGVLACLLRGAPADPVP